MARWTLEKLETASRKQLKTYLESLGKETYPEESTAELRDSAIHYFEQTLPEEDSGLSVRSASDYDADLDSDYDLDSAAQ